MAKPDSICGCIPLRTACYIVGCLNLIEAALFLLVKQPELFTALTFWIILTIVLFVGLRKNLARNLLAYLIYDVLFSLMSLWYILVAVPNLPIVGLDDEVLAANLLVIYACYRVLCWFVIRSQYVAIKLEENVIKEAPAANV